MGSGTVTVNGENYGSFNLIANSDINLKPLTKGNAWNDFKSNLGYVFSFWLGIVKSF